MIIILAAFALAQTPNPQRAQQLIGEGIHLVQQEQLEDAADRFRRATELTGDTYETHQLLGSALLIVGELDGAEPELRRAIELQPSSGAAHRDLGILLLRRNPIDEAATELHGR